MGRRSLHEECILLFSRTESVVLINDPRSSVIMSPIAKSSRIRHGLIDPLVVTV